MKQLVVCIICIWISGIVNAQEDAVSPELEAAIGELMDVTGALEIGEQFAEVIVSQMSNTLRQSNPDVPEQAFTIIREEVMATISGELQTGRFAALIMPVYAKYFSLEEIQQLLAFYQTPIGRKTIEVMPLLSQESMQIGQSWGMGIGPVIGQRVSQRLAAEGIAIE